LSQQYATDANLQARIDLHARFATNPGWHRWAFERETAGPVSRILEIGCGPASLWRENLDRIDPGWSLTLLDSSPGMIEAARGFLGSGAEYVVGEAEELPFADESFDVVLANHMLYHVPDRPRAFAEISRILTPGGRFHAALNGRDHLEELRVLVGPEWSFSRYMDRFCLDDAPTELAPFFGDIRLERFDTALLVTEVEPVVAYVRSSESYPDGTLDRVREAAEAALARDGAFRITTTPGLISCRKP
jgi:ubiquinone/menaquinone biosynthesis C-methylase UbiE